MRGAGCCGMSVLRPAVGNDLPAYTLLVSLNSLFSDEKEITELRYVSTMYRRTTVSQKRAVLDALIFDKSNLSSSTECFTSSGPMSKILTLFPRSPKLIDYSGVSAYFDGCVAYHCHGRLQGRVRVRRNAPPCTPWTWAC